MKNHYLTPTDEAAKHLFTKSIQGELVMLNLLRFKALADYSKFPDIAPHKPISGKQAYQTYIDQTLPFLQESGGEIMLLGTCDQFFIGPEDESWDLMMLIKQKSIADFLAFASNPQYLKVIGHREAAIEDSRLLPSTAINKLT